jgi:hypothetical protein
MPTVVATATSEPAAAKSIAVAMVPGPANMGIASGVGATRIAVELERPRVRTWMPVDAARGARKMSLSRSADGQTHVRNQVLLGVALGRYVIPFHLLPNG